MRRMIRPRFAWSAPRPLGLGPFGLDLLVFGLLASSLAACGGRMVSVDGGGGGTDAGSMPDAGPPPTDAGPEPIDAGPPDAGEPDAGPPPGCMCPALPTECSPPTLDTPVFSPDAEAMVGQIVDVIACADSTLDIAVYRGNWDCLVDAVNTQLTRDSDLQVRIIVDNEDCESGECLAERLAPSERVTVIRDTRIGSLMHHKLVIADDSRVWIGSANFNEGSFCREHNNSLVLEQPEIVAALATEYDRMAGGDFSPISAEDGAPTTGGRYTLYFSPVSPQSSPGPWFDAMRAAIESAETSIDVMTNAWTRSELATDMLMAQARGVTVRAVVSSRFANELPAQVLAMADANIREDIVHDKVMIIDGQTVITGSANWSMNAWSNNENQLWIDDTAVAALYTAEFETVYAAAEPVPYME